MEIIKRNRKSVNVTGRVRAYINRNEINLLTTQFDTDEFLTKLQESLYNPALDAKPLLFQTLSRSLRKVKAEQKRKIA